LGNREQSAEHWPVAVRHRRRIRASNRRSKIESVIVIVR
jgi:hypothetical protein